MNPQVLASQNTYHITFFASMLIWLMFMGLIILWLIDGRIKKEQALHAFLSSLIAWAVSQMIKNLFPTLRPFEINGDPPLTITIPGDGSFPSGHAAAAFGLALSVWLHDKKLGLIFILSALFVAIGRVSSNVHSFIDVLSGAVLGSVTSFILEKMHVARLLK